MPIKEPLTCARLNSSNPNPVVPFRVRLQYFLAATMCRYRRFPPVKAVGQLSFLVWRAYENRDFNMATNGERWLLRRLSTLGCRAVFDVGANIGEWSRLCREHLPAAMIHSFEIAPPIFEKLSQQLAGISNIKLNAFGLGDRAGAIQLYYPEADSCVTTAYPRMLEDIHDYDPTKNVHEITGRIMTGDAYLAQNAVDFVDVLKIDVEGMEESVLKGFELALSGGRIRLVQFEYNTTNITSHFLLRDAYDLLARHGYRLGKLYPDHVEFRDYHYRHEDFCGPNLIAVRRDDAELIRLLA